MLYTSPHPEIHPSIQTHGATSASDVLFNKVIRHQSESVSREVDSYLTRVWEPSWLRELHLAKPSAVYNCLAFGFRELHLANPPHLTVCGSYSVSLPTISNCPPLLKTEEAHEARMICCVKLLRHRLHFPVSI